LVTPLLYSEVPLLIASLGTSYHDATVQRWEAGLFNGQPAMHLAAAAPLAAVSEMLHASYLAYYPLIYVPPILLYTRGDSRGYAETVAALALVYVVCFVAFAVFPVQGPRYLWPQPASLPSGPIRA